MSNQIPNRLNKKQIEIIENWYKKNVQKAKKITFSIEDIELSTLRKIEAENKYNINFLRFEIENYVATIGG